MTATKSTRLNVRLRPADDELIRRAAQESGQTVTDFMTASARERAKELLADQKSFRLDAETWEQFVKLLDRPVVPSPQLVELFSRPPRITR